MCILTEIRKIFFGLVVIGLAACSQETFDPSSPLSQDNDTPFELTLSEQKNGLWRLDVDLFTPQSALMFSRSRHDYRSQTYKVLSQGAELHRIGGFDTIIFDAGVMRASFEVTPFTDTLPGTYTPYIPFSDGGQAIYLGAFELLRVANADAVANLEGDLDAWDGKQFDIPVHLKTDVSILLEGEVHSGSAQTIVNGNGPYAYLGPTPLVEGNNFYGVMDPGLPAWLMEGFDEDLSNIFAVLEEGFGHSLEDKATIMFAFRGYETEGFSNTGGVLDGGLMVLETSGDGMREPNDRLRRNIEWFLTHEATHLFQNREGIHYADRSDSWLNEGGANAVTHYLMAKLETSADEIILSRYQESFAFCVSSIKDTSMRAITERNDQSHYDCGDFVFRISDAALPEADLFDIWGALLAQAGDDEHISTAKYFAALRELGANEDIVARLEAFVAGPVAAPAVELGEMLEAVGIEAAFEDGELKSIQFPE